MFCSPKGVEVKLKDRFYPILIAATHVKELIEIKLQDDGVLIGASVSLTALEKFLRQCITDLPGKLSTINTRKFLPNV